MNITVENVRDEVTVRCYGRLVYSLRGRSSPQARHHRGPQRRDRNRRSGNRRLGIASSGWYLSEAGRDFRGRASSIEGDARVSTGRA